MQPKQSRYGANAIEISSETNIKADAARQALLALRKTFQHWVMIGEAIVALRERANELGGRKTFQRLMEQQGLGTLVTAKTKAVTSRLEKIMRPENLPKVQEWYATLNDTQQIEWASPSSVIRRCPVFANPKKQSSAQGKIKPTPSTATDLIREVNRLEHVLEAGLKPQIVAWLGKMNHRKRFDAMHDFAKLIEKQFPELEIRVSQTMSTIKIVSGSEGEAKKRKAKKPVAGTRAGVIEF